MSASEIHVFILCYTLPYGIALCNTLTKITSELHQVQEFFLLMKYSLYMF
jgi:hypothetical protein